jgi:MFS family permease
VTGFAGTRRGAALGGPLALRPFRLLIAGQFGSTIGDLCSAVALPWLILSGSGGTVLLGTVLACFGVSRVATIPLGGILADRFGGRPVMLATDAARTAAAAALAGLAFHGSPTLAQLAPIALVLGGGSGLFLSSSYTVLPALLPRDQLGRGNALSTMVVQAGGVLGPGVGGALVATLSPAWALTVDAASFALSAATLLAMHPARSAAVAGDDAEDGDTADRDTADSDTARESDAEPPPQTGPSLRGLLRHGRLLHLTLAVALLSNVAYSGTIEVALPNFAHQNLGAAGYGVLLTAMSLGALCGSLAAARAPAAQSPAYLFTALALVMGLGLALVPYAGGLAGATAAIFAYSVGSGWQNIVAVTMLQLWSPPALVGRVMSLVMLAVMGTFPVSVAVAGFAVHRLGSTAFFPVAGAAIAGTVLLALTRPTFRNHRHGDAYTAAIPTAPPPAQPAALPIPPRAAAEEEIHR